MILRTFWKRTSACFPTTKIFHSRKAVQLKTCKMNLRTFSSAIFRATLGSRIGSIKTSCPAFSSHSKVQSSYIASRSWTTFHSASCFKIYSQCLKEHDLSCQQMESAIRLVDTYQLSITLPKTRLCLMSIGRSTWRFKTWTKLGLIIPWWWLARTKFMRSEDRHTLKERLIPSRVWTLVKYTRSLTISGDN